MIPEMYREIIQNLIEKSQRGDVEWKPTPDEDKFLVSFPKGSLGISRYEVSRSHLVPGTTHRPVFQTQIVKVELFQEGRRIDGFECEAHEDPDYPLLNDLFQVARRTAMRVEQVVELVRQELSRSGKVGVAN